MENLVKQLWGFYNSLLTSWWGRFVRVAVAAKITALVVAAQANPTYAWLLPAIVAFGKGLRDKWPGRFEWIPI